MDSKKFKKRIIGRLKRISAMMLCACIGVCTSGDCDVAEPAMIKAYPVDHGRYVSNPGMGWNFCYFSNNLINFGTTLKDGDTLDWWPGADIVFFRLGWSHLEPEEGVYNWDITDRVVDQWRAAGKRAAFCWVVCYPGFQDTPLWVRDAGAKGVLFDPVKEAEAKGFTYKIGSSLRERGLSFSETWMPNYDDPVFLEKLSNFLAAAAKRYDGQPWVEFVQVGSIGSWGEGHVHLSWPAVITSKARRLHLNLWKRHFPNTRLFINKGWRNDEVLFEARDMGYGVGDHSLQVPGPYFKNYVGDPERAANFWPQVPVEIENHPTTLPGARYEQAVENWRPSYLRIHSNPYKAWSAQRERICRMGLRMGYRFQFPEIAFPDRVRGGEPFRIQFNLCNAGSAPCYLGGHVQLHLRPVNGGSELVFTDTGFNVRSLSTAAKGNPVPQTKRDLEFAMPDSEETGSYQIYLSIRSGRGGLYRLPYDDAEQGTYLFVGEMQLEGKKSVVSSG